MKVLVTGGAGFIGQHVVRELLSRGHGVRVMDSLRPDVHEAMRWTPPDEIETEIGDVRDRDAVSRALSGVEAVIHLAAKVGLGVDIADLPDYAASNDAGTAELLAGMARADVLRLTLASSMVVYGEGLAQCPEHGAVAPAPRRESDLAAGRFEPPCPICGHALKTGLVGEGTPLDPRNAYASSKVAQEFYCNNWARVTGGSVAHMRYHNVYGPGLPRNTPYAGVAAIFTSALRRGEAPRVFEDGRQRRDFVHVRDVAAATVLACERHVSGVRAFNVGSGTPRTVGDMAEALARTMGGPDPIVTGQYRLGDVRHITADSSRLRSELNWLPQVEFAAGMAELAAVSGLQRQAAIEYSAPT
jgi:dTDP-L-rhamnose 4-epimerase